MNIDVQTKDGEEVEIDNVEAFWYDDNTLWVEGDDIEKTFENGKVIFAENKASRY